MPGFHRFNWKVAPDTKFDPELVTKVRYGLTKRSDHAGSPRHRHRFRHDPAKRAASGGDRVRDLAEPSHSLSINADVLALP